MTITYNNRDTELTSIEQMKSLISEAMREDIRRSLTVTPNTNIDNNNRLYAQHSRVKEVKSKIYAAHLKLTNDFRTSIYK